MNHGRCAPATAVADAAIWTYPDGDSSGTPRAAPVDNSPTCASCSPKSRSIQCPVTFLIVPGRGLSGKITVDPRTAPSHTPSGRPTSKITLDPGTSGLTRLLGVSPRARSRSFGEQVASHAPRGDPLHKITLDPETSAFARLPGVTPCTRSRSIRERVPSHASSSRPTGKVTLDLGSSCLVVSARPLDPGSSVILSDALRYSARSRPRPCSYRSANGAAGRGGPWGRGSRVTHRQGSATDEFACSASSRRPAGRADGQQVKPTGQQVGPTASKRN